MKPRTRVIDLDTAERLLAGRVSPADVPRELAGVASVLQAAAQLSPTEPPSALLAEMVGEVSTAGGGRVTPVLRPSRSRGVQVRVAAAVALTAVCFTGAAAAAGVLPDAAQGRVARVARHVGVQLPQPSQDHDDQDEGRPDAAGVDSSDATGSLGAPTPASDAGAGTKPEQPRQPGTHGEDVSTVAKDTDATGADKGAEVSATARDGHAQAPAEPPAATPGPSANAGNGGENGNGGGNGSPAKDSHEDAATTPSGKPATSRAK